MPEWRNWYTHSTQNAATRVMSVRVRPRAPRYKIGLEIYFSKPFYFDLSIIEYDFPVLTLLKNIIKFV